MLGRLAFALALLACASAAHAEAPVAPAPPPQATPQATPEATLNQPPKLTRFVHAVPPPALAAHGHAEVILTIDLDDTGKVVSVVVAQPSAFPDEGFEEAALAAAQKFEFQPGRAGGKPVPVRITYRYKFLYQAPPPPAPTATPTGPAAPAVEQVPLSGRILAKGDRTPLGAVNVLIDGDEHVATSDEDGRFRFDALPVGAHRVHLRGTTIAPADLTLTLSPNRRLEVTWYVATRARYTSTVRGEKVVQETVELALSGDEVRRIPGTQGDTLKAVQSLPGVARAPFGGGQIVVWGSAPGDTRVYVDGVYFPNLFHFVALRSTVNSELVSGLTYTPGGYGVEHGRGLGGVVEIESRQPRSDGYHGFLQIDLIDASLLVEGPITKTLSFAVAARRSLIDTWLPAVTTSNFQLSPAYWDYQAKLAWRPTPRDDLDVFIFGSDDTVKLLLKRPDPSLSSAFDSHIFFHRILARHQHRFAKGVTLTVTPSFGYDQPFQAAGSAGNRALEANEAIYEYSLRAVARVPLYSWLRLDAGLDFEGSRYDLSGQGPAVATPREGDPPGFRTSGAYVSDAATLFSHFVGPFVAADVQLFDGRLRIQPQLRLEVYTFSGYHGTPDAYSKAYVELEPRLALRYQINKWAAVKAALGVYHQPADALSLLRKLGNPNVVPEFGTHYVLGVDFDPTKTLHVELEGFYKDLRQLIVRGEALGDPLLDNDGIGRVYGGELLVRQELWKNFFGWVSYTVSRSERRDHPDQPWRVFQYDQTHILTIVASYKLPRGFQLGARFRYVTGNPDTPVVGSYFDANQASYRPLLGPTYSIRAADFHQLDLRLDKVWIFDRWKLSIYLDIQNVYYHRSEEGLAYNYDYTQSQPISGLPIVPAFGIRGEL